MAAARTADAALDGLLALAPEGRLWPRGPGTRFAALLRPLAGEHAAFEEDAEALCEEADPRTASALLADYERVLGPDPCVDWTERSPGERQAAAHARWTARGGASAAYFVRLAASYGVPVRVTEYRPSVAGEAEAGEEVASAEDRFAWEVEMPPTSETDALAGEAQAGDPLGDVMPSFLECVFRRLAPAHTTVVFSYTEGPA